MSHGAVAQGIEQAFPKRCVAGSIPVGPAKEAWRAAMLSRPFICSLASKHLILAAISLCHKYV